jgi:RimJ/RimL family protein N-acetyltransferase
VQVAHPNPSVRGKHVYLRPLEREDITVTLRAVNDREIADLVGFPFPVGQAMSQKWFDDEVVKKQGETAFFFAICELGSADLIGECGFQHVHRGIHSDVGIFLLPEFVGRGLGTDAMNALVDFGFGELGLERVGLHVDPHNERAIRSYEKSGFSREGVLRSVRHHRGQVMDDLVMSIVRAEWEALDRPRSWDYPAPKAAPKRRRQPRAVTEKPRRR